MVKNPIIQFALFKMNNFHIALIHNTLYALITSEIFQDVARNVSTIEFSNCQIVKQRSEKRRSH